MGNQTIELGDGLRLDPATPDESGALTAFQRAAYAAWLPVIGAEPLPYSADYTALLRDHEAWLARDSDRVLVGALVLKPADDHLLIWSVAVAPAAVGRGIGRRLIAFAEARARRDGLELRLFTNALMTKNIDLYQQLGFIETGRERRVTGHEVVHMAKRTPAA